MPERKLWYVYTGKVWEPDTGNVKVMEYCKKLADGLLYYALSLPEGNKRDEYHKHAYKWQSRHYRETVLKDAQSVYPVRLSDLDSDPYLFNCQNGTLDLRTRAFHAHNPADMLSTISGVEYDPGARSELWARTVGDVMQGDIEPYRIPAKGSGLRFDWGHVRGMPVSPVRSHHQKRQVYGDRDLHPWKRMTPACTNGFFACTQASLIRNLVGKLSAASITKSYS